MSLIKSIIHGKEHRVQYGTKGQPYCKLVDYTCRNHGGRSGGAGNQCIWCLFNKTKKDSFLDKESKREIEEYKKYKNT